MNFLGVHSLKRKFGFTFAALTLLSTLILSIALYQSNRRSARESLREQLLHTVDLANMIVDVDAHIKIKDPKDTVGPDYVKIKKTFQRILEKAPYTTWIYTLRQREDGKICFVLVAGNKSVVSDLPGLNFGDVYDNPNAVIMPVFKTFSQPIVAKEFNTDRWGTWLSGFSPLVTSDGSRDGVLGIDISADEVLSREHRFFWVSLSVFLTIAPLATVLGWWLGCRLASPIVNLTAGVNRIAEGDLNNRVPVTGVDEISQLASAFNNMTAKLIRAFATLQEEISTRTRAEEEVRTLNQELESRVAQRTCELENANKEMEAFTYSVSHDLRAPLRTMHSSSEILLEDYGDKLDEEGRKYLSFLKEGSYDMDRLIDGLLTLAHSKRTAIKMQSVNLSELVTEYISSLRKREPERRASVQITEGLVVRGDQILIKAVVENLIGNAWKYTSKRENAQIEFGSEQRDGESYYYVRDNGVGFDEAYAQKLFLPFQRLHHSDEFPGYGIGLATVKMIISRHGGRVLARSALGVGSEFGFTLPETSV